MLASILMSLPDQQGRTRAICQEVSSLWRIFSLLANIEDLKTHRMISQNGWSSGMSSPATQTEDPFERRGRKSLGPSATRPSPLPLLRWCTAGGFPRGALPGRRAQGRSSSTVSCEEGILRRDFNGHPVIQGNCSFNMDRSCFILEAWSFMSCSKPGRLWLPLIFQRDWQSEKLFRGILFLSCWCAVMSFQPPSPLSGLAKLFFYRVNHGQSMTIEWDAVATRFPRIPMPRNNVQCQ